MTWAKVLAKLEATPDTMKALQAMEATGGEPDVIGYDKKADQFLFCDCAAESPPGRRSLCYDGAALEARKENKPKRQRCMRTRRSSQAWSVAFVWATSSIR